MKKRNLLTVAGLSLIGLTFGLFNLANIASAQTAANNGGQALEIAPPVLILTANPGQTIKTQISLRDISTSSLVVGSQVNDFVANGEDGTPKIILDETEPNPYSLKNWVGFLPDLTLKSKEIKNLPVTITVPANASPGGYYGVVRFTATPPDLKGTGVSLSASLGALILLRVNGEVKENLTIESFSVNQDGKSGSLFESTPLQFVERLKNSGNIHEQPSGQITINDMFNKKVAVLNINLSANNILPQSIRKFDQPLDSTVIGNRMLFGKYTANMRITYGAKGQVLTKSFTFWIIPYRLIGVIIVSLIILFTGLYLVMKRYNRFIISKAQKSRPKHKK